MQPKQAEKTPVVVEQNSNNGTWDVGWQTPDGFVPQYCGYATKKEAEAEIPGFDERLEREFSAFMAGKDAEEREQNEVYPNLGYVRTRIKKLIDRGRPQDLAAAFDAGQKLDWLLDMDLHQHITWPLPSWPQIRSGRVYGR